MRIVHEYSHFGGTELLKVRYPEQDHEIKETIASVQALKGKDDPVYSADAIYSGFQQEFAARGYGELHEDVIILNLDHAVSTRGAFTQVDFAKGKVLTVVRFGSYESMFYDLVRFQHFAHENKCDVGVEIVPCHALHRQMSSGVSYGEQLVYDIERLKRHFPAVPVKVILIDVDE